MFTVDVKQQSNNNNKNLAVACDVFNGVSFCCPFSHVLNEIWDLTGSFSEGFPTYFSKNFFKIFIANTMNCFLIQRQIKVNTQAMFRN